MSDVVVEFFGVPRARAGRAELRVRADTVAEALLAVAELCPRLADVLSSEGRIDPRYLVAIDGQAFAKDPDAVLRSGDRLLLLSADAGG